MLIRENYLSKIRGFYDSDLIKVLVGIRRCGKSVILNQIIEELKEKRNIDEDHIIFINFEFIEYEDLLDYKELNKYIKSKIKDKKIYYLFLDEVQNVDSFEKVINSLRASVKNISIFITGSNSKMLSDELSTVLSGRYVLFNINPLSYKEYVELTNKNVYDIETFWDYAKWGGLPNRCEFSNEVDIKNYLHSVYDSIILRDVVKRLNLKDTILFDMILQYLIETAGREFSAENINKFLEKEYKKISNETLYNYIDALCKALILKKVYRYDIAGKGVLKTLNKYYATDLGIAQIKNNNPEFKSYIILENIVYNELINRNYEVYIGKTKNGEVDFLIKKDGKIKYIQVTYELYGNDRTIEREFGAFKSIDDNYPKYVISLDKMDLSRDGIIHLNLIDFLLDDKI
ncbi:MAG: ATP-binding protein [Bacilli bacterium]|nr:ATP-binding protein [Bacilli bacterium]